MEKARRARDVGVLAPPPHGRDRRGHAAPAARIKDGATAPRSRHAGRGAICAGEARAEAVVIGIPCSWGEAGRTDSLGPTALAIDTGIKPARDLKAGAILR